MIKKITMAAAIAAISMGAQASEILSFESIANAGANSNNSGLIITASPDPSFTDFVWSSSSNTNIQLLDETRATGNKSLTNIAPLMGSSGETLGQWVGYINSTNNVSFASASSFNLESIYLYSKSASSVTIQGYDAAGDLISSAVKNISFSAQTGNTIALSEFSGVNKITISGSNLVFDNIQVSAVPEPSSIAMLLAGLGMMGVIARRRTRA